MGGGLGLDLVPTPWTLQSPATVVPLGSARVGIWAAHESGQPLYVCITEHTMPAKKFLLNGQEQSCEHFLSRPLLGTSEAQKGVKGGVPSSHPLLMCTVPHI